MSSDGEFSHRTVSGRSIDISVWPTSDEGALSDRDRATYHVCPDSQKAADARSGTMKLSQRGGNRLMQGFGNNFLQADDRPRAALPGLPCVIIPFITQGLMVVFRVERVYDGIFPCMSPPYDRCRHPAT